MSIIFENSKKIILFAVLLMIALVLSMQSVSAEIAPATYMGDDCVIPESGPWPPCATGGDNTGGASDECVIPESGPWPPCATGGGNTGGSTGGSGGCVIPDAGPWPPCATGGNGGGGGGATEPPAPTEPAEPEILGYITIVYDSNPDEVLGVFPVILFDAELLYSRMLLNQQALNEMRNSLGGTLDGEQAACDTYEAAYERIKANGIFFVGIPDDWAEIDFYYYITFIFALDRTRPAYLSCFDSGQVAQFNHDLAFQTINQTLDLLNPTIDAAAAKLGN